MFGTKHILNAFVSSRVCLVCQLHFKSQPDLPMNYLHTKLYRNDREFCLCAKTR